MFGGNIPFVIKIQGQTFKKVACLGYTFAIEQVELIISIEMIFSSM
jgi:hypothetical protein